MPLPTIIVIDYSQMSPKASCSCKCMFLEAARSRLCDAEIKDVVLVLIHSVMLIKVPHQAYECYTYPKGRLPVNKEQQRAAVVISCCLLV